jgi:hypothetical protein
MKERFYAIVQLTADDVAALKRRVEGDGGFQRLLRELQDLRIDGHLYIPSEAIAERIIRYAYEYGSGGWQGRLQRWADQLPPVHSHAQGALF